MTSHTETISPPLRDKTIQNKKNKNRAKPSLSFSLSRENLKRAHKSGKTTILLYIERSDKAGRRFCRMVQYKLLGVSLFSRLRSLFLFRSDLSSISFSRGGKRHGSSSKTSRERERKKVSGISCLSLLSKKVRSNTPPRKS